MTIDDSLHPFLQSSVHFHFLIPFIIHYFIKWEILLTRVSILWKINIYENITVKFIFMKMFILTY